LGRDGHRHTADRRDGLAEFVVQLMRDEATLLLDALLYEERHLAPLIEPRLSLLRVLLRLHLVLLRLAPCG
jgi:hypothetical protein